MFSGGAFSNASIFALGIMPYISASIIIQLLTVLSPQLSELRKEEVFKTVPPLVLTFSFSVKNLTFIILLIFKLYCIF